MKTTLTLLLLTISAISLNAQNLFTKSLTETKGLPSFVAKKTNATILSYYKSDKLKTETTLMDSKQINLIGVSGATVINHIANDKNCGQFSREEMNKDSLEMDAIIHEVQIERTNETKKVLGYTCKKIIIRYQVIQTAKFDCEMELWCTDELKIPNSSNLPELNKRNALTAALASLNTFPLETETWMKGNNVRTSSKIIEVSTKEIDEAVFNFNPKDCKKTLNMKEYKAMLLKRQHQANGLSGWY